MIPPDLPLAPPAMYIPMQTPRPTVRFTDRKDPEAPLLRIHWAPQPQANTENHKVEEYQATTGTQYMYMVTHKSRLCKVVLAIMNGGA